MEKSLYPLPS